MFNKKWFLKVFFFQNPSGSDTTWIIGIPFLKNVYSIFDQGEFRVGFATLKQP
jgi:hypothetical protein